jgi:hypothetical protein
MQATRCRSRWSKCPATLHKRAKRLVSYASLIAASTPPPCLFATLLNPKPPPPALYRPGRLPPAARDPLKPQSNPPRRRGRPRQSSRARKATSTHFSVVGCACGNHCVTGACSLQPYRPAMCCATTSPSAGAIRSSWRRGGCGGICKALRRRFFTTFTRG